MRNNLKVELLDLNVCSNIIEYIKVKGNNLSSKVKYTNILGMYRPPNTSLKDFNLELEKININAHGLNSNDTVIAGDRNICLVK